MKGTAVELHDVQTVVKSTGPILRDRGLEIVKLFYKTLFSERPDIAAMFNMENQRMGTQPTKLAGAVYAWSQHMHEPEKLARPVEAMVVAHCNAGVRAEHYPIIGHYLLRAMSEVLGEAATPEILEAWGQAYNTLADILITLESDAYTRRLTLT